MSKVLVISPDAVPAAGVLAAGPGIRYWQISKSLAVDYGHDVTLAVPAPDFTPDSQAPFNLVRWSLETVIGLVDGYDCVILPHVHSGLSTLYREAADAAVPTAVDLYDPVLIENIGLQPRSDEGLASFAGYLAGVVPILKRGDFFVCANERQYYYYLGVLNVLGRINPLTYHADILQLVPFGVDDRPPAKTRSAMRGSLVDDDDRVVLWFSGIYPWFDAYTLVEAMPAVVREMPRAKLVIMGGVHPRGHAPDSEFKRTKDRASELGLVGKQVFFAGWQPYEDRANWYLESDLAVTTHKKSLETELSHRTRVIDFLWGGLPVITSSGDAVGEMVESAQCGLTVPPGDVAALTEAILEILGNEDKRQRMSLTARQLAVNELTWKKVVRPLADFCAAPRLAPDRLSDKSIEVLLPAVDTLAEHARVLGQDGPRPAAWQMVRNVFRTEGFVGLMRRSAGALVRRAFGAQR